MYIMMSYAGSAKPKLSGLSETDVIAIVKAVVEAKDADQEIGVYFIDNSGIALKYPEPAPEPPVGPMETFARV